MTTTRQPVKPDQRSLLQRKQGIMPTRHEFAMRRFHHVVNAALKPERITLIHDEDGTVLGGVLENNRSTQP